MSEIKETRRFAPVIPVQCFPPPGCEGSAVGRGGNRQPVSLGGRPVTCWGLGSARRGGGGGGWERSPRHSGTVRGGSAGGGRRTETRGGPAQECTFLRPGRLRTGVENSLGWGFAPSPPPHPRIPFQARLESSQTCAGKFKEQRGAGAVGRDNGRK